GVDVDHDQSRGPAGDPDAELRVGAPPLLDTGEVQRGGPESVAPATGGRAAAPPVGVPGLTAGRAVARRRLASRRQRMDRPATARAPPGDGQGPRDARYGGSGPR